MREFVGKSGTWLLMVLIMAMCLPPMGYMPTLWADATRDWGSSGVETLDGESEWRGPDRARRALVGCVVCTRAPSLVLVLVKTSELLNKRVHLNGIVHGIVAALAALASGSGVLPHLL